MDKYRTNKEEDKDENLMKATRNIDNYSNEREYKNNYQHGDDKKEVRFYMNNILYLLG